MIECKECGIKKSEDNYYKKTKTRLSTVCKQCTSLYNKEKYIKIKDEIKERVKKYYYKNWDKCRDDRRKWAEDNKSKISAYKKKYANKVKINNPGKVKKHRDAHQAIRKALRKNKLTKPDTCTRCKHYSKHIHAHHHKGYNEDNKLNVIWLCAKCHIREHKINYEEFKKYNKWSQDLH